MAVLKGGKPTKPNQTSSPNPMNDTKVDCVVSTPPDRANHGIARGKGRKDVIIIRVCMMEMPRLVCRPAGWLAGLRLAGVVGDTSCALFLLLTEKRQPRSWWCVLMV